MLHGHMAPVHGQLDRLDGADLHAVERFGRLGQFDERVVATQEPLAPAVVEIAVERRAPDVHPQGGAPADLHGVRRVPSVERERPRSLRDLLHHERAIQADALLLELLARIGEQRSRPLMQDVHADLLQDPHRLVVDLLLLLRRQDDRRLGPEERRAHAIASSTRGVRRSSSGAIPMSWISSGLPM